MIRVVTEPGGPGIGESPRGQARGYTVASMEQPEGSAGRALVVVVDDRRARGVAEDHSGPLVTELLNEAGFVVDGVVVVSADEVEIRNALNTAVIGGVDLVVSVGGTGVSPRDVTPEATRAVLDAAATHGIPPGRMICTGDVVAYCAEAAETVAGQLL